MPNYVILTPVPGPKFCALQRVENLADPLLLKKAQRLEPWPTDVRFHMDPNFPKAIQLADCLENKASGIVVSKRLKELIEAERPSDVEYLPISIIDHKGKVASADYFLVNPYKLQDCIDKEASTIQWNPIDPTLISACTKMVIDEQKIDSGAKVFRLKHYPTKVMFARDLADKIKQSKSTGITFIEISNMRY
jgi:hypothetical protein